MSLRLSTDENLCVRGCQKCSVRNLAVTIHDSEVPAALCKCRHVLAEKQKEILHALLSARGDVGLQHMAAGTFELRVVNIVAWNGLTDSLRFLRTGTSSSLRFLSSCNPDEARTALMLSQDELCDANLHLPSRKGKNNPPSTILLSFLDHDV
jgi:hypothetical protein